MTRRSLGIASMLTISSTVASFSTLLATSDRDYSSGPLAMADELCGWIMTPTVSGELAELLCNGARLIVSAHRVPTVATIAGALFANLTYDLLIYHGREYVLLS